MLSIDDREEGLDWGEFPTDRRVGLRLLWLLDDPNTTAEELTRVISADPALSARTLSVANARFYRQCGRVRTLGRAVSVIGLPAVRSLASTCVLQLFSAENADLPDHFWIHSTLAAVAAARMARKVGVDPAEALTAALLHDFGEQLLRSRDPQRFDEFSRAVSREPIDARLAIERRSFGIDHATLGSQTLAMHGLPTSITDAVREHHLLSAGSSMLTRVVHMADCTASVIQGDTHLDLDKSLRSLRFDEDAQVLVAQCRDDQRALLRFVAGMTTP
jgi:putative nucleotidyltransferase with HDIG domain